MHPISICYFVYFYLAEFISTVCFCVVFTVFSLYYIMSSVYNDSFTSSLPIWLTFISFSSLIAAAKTSNTMLNTRGSNGYLSLVSDFTGKIFSFSPLSIMLFSPCYVGLSQIAFIMLKYVPSVPTVVRVFIMSGC